MDYYHAQGEVMCKLFAQTQVEALMMWFKTLPYGSIDSMKVLCDSFTALFAIQKPKLITMVILCEVILNKGNLAEVH